MVITMVHHDGPQHGNARFMDKLLPTQEQTPIRLRQLLAHPVYVIFGRLAALLEYCAHLFYVLGRRWVKILWRHLKLVLLQDRNQPPWNTGEMQRQLSKAHGFLMRFPGKLVRRNSIQYPPRDL